MSTKTGMKILDEIELIEDLIIPKGTIIALSDGGMGRLIIERVINNRSKWKQVVVTKNIKENS